MNRTTTALIALTMTVLSIPAATVGGVQSSQPARSATAQLQPPVPRIDPLPLSSQSVDISPAEPVADSQPKSDVIGGTDEQIAVVKQAIERFQAVGLELPQVTIHLHSAKSHCGGFQGVFNLDGSGHRVDVCNSKPMTVLHELAHLWEHHNATEGQRQELMDLHGATEWFSLDDDWADRGIEIAAEIIAGGLLEMPLVRAQLEDAPLKAESFRLITGLESPRFEDGVDQLEVAAG